MDELLSLFDDNNNTASKEAAVAADVRPVDDELRSNKQVTTDDFASAFSKPIQKNKQSTTSTAITQSTSKAFPAAINKVAAAGKVSKNNLVACDPITGLRITDRKTSRAEMVEHFAMLTYKSVAMLAASSRKEWATYTTDGSDKGSTNLATCGIITADTSSRVSSNTGRAFAMIQLGDSTSPGISGVPPSKSNNIHALVTVFLFGEALSVIKQNKRFLQKGFVVSILQPSLMPSRDDKGSSSTAVSLSVNDPRQILLIGRSVDCGNCKGTIRKKVASDYGPKWEDVGCSTLIDLRGGSAYCLTHRRQGLSSRGSTNSTNKASDSRLQKLRADNVRNGVSHTSTFNNQRNISSQSAVQGGRTASISLSEALSQPGFLDETLPAASSTIATRQLKVAPKHMKKAVNAIATKATNPYAKSKSEQSVKRRDNDDILGEALERKKARLDNHSSNSKKTSTKPGVKPKCKVFHVEGYDGSVQVPKPSSLFRKSAFSVPVSSYSNTNKQPATSDILEKQRSLAELLQQKKQGVVNSKTEELLSRLSSKRVQSSSTTGQSSHNNFASTFGDFGNESNRDSLLCAQSRFASAANAQEYARARGAIHELEAKEFEMDQRKQRAERTGTNKNGGKSSDALSTKASNNGGIVTAGWICRSCKKKTPFKPVSCIRAKHDVQQQRELKNRISSDGSTKERLQRHGMDSDDGGLTLGSGLEWSYYRGGLN